MIPEHLQHKIATRLNDEIGVREDVGSFVFTFSALDSSRDVDYALGQLALSDDPVYKQAIHIVLEGICERTITSIIESSDKKTWERFAYKGTLIKNPLEELKLRANQAEEDGMDYVLVPLSLAFACIKETE